MRGTPEATTPRPSHTPRPDESRAVRLDTNSIQSSHRRPRGMECAVPAAYDGAGHPALESTRAAHLTPVAERAINAGADDAPAFGVIALKGAHGRTSAVRRRQWFPGASIGYQSRSPHPHLARPAQQRMLLAIAVDRSIRRQRKSAPHKGQAPTLPAYDTDVTSPAELPLIRPAHSIGSSG